MPWIDILANALINHSAQMCLVALAALVALGNEAA